MSPSEPGKRPRLMEYALVIVLAAVVVVPILTVLGPSIGNVFFGVHYF